VATEMQRKNDGGAAGLCCSLVLRAGSAARAGAF
jgi:hypothetical protein